MCTLTEKDRQSSRLRSSALFHVKLSVCIRATIAKGEETDGKATFRTGRPGNETKLSY